MRECGHFLPGCTECFQTARCDKRGPHWRHRKRLVSMTIRWRNRRTRGRWVDCTGYHLTDESPVTGMDVVIYDYYSGYLDEKRTIADE